MSSPSFWADETDLLMLYDEIVKLNTETISTNGTSMYDLKNQPEFVDGINLNERILKSSQEDAKYKGYDVSAGEETNILSYEDVFVIEEYAISAMQYVVGSGIIAGKTNSTLNPKDNATRQKSQ